MVPLALVAALVGATWSRPSTAQADEEEGPPVALGSYVDFVTVQSGERIRGDIKELNRGKLRYKTRATDIIYYTWELVTALESPRTFQVETLDGEYYFGSFVASEEPRVLRIASESWVQDVPMDEVATISQIKSTFWGRLDGSISVGLSIVTASNQNQLTFHGDATSTSRRARSSLYFDNITNRGDPENPVSRQDLVGSYLRYLKRRWGVLGASSLQANEELNLDLRALISGVGTRRFVQSQKRLLAAGLGLAVQREKYTGSDFSTEVEAVIQVDYEAFSFVARDTDVTNRLVIYPSLTTAGRVRVELNMRGRRELYKDLFWDLNLNYSFDSDPPAGASTGPEESGPRNDDLTLTLSLAWKF